MTESTSTRHVSYEQIKIMIDFMGQHVEFATGSLRTLEARHTSKKLWNELTKMLNNTRSGTKKSSDGWSKYWSDFKNKLKNKVSIIKKRKRSGSTSGKSGSLTRLEKRALIILGPHFEKKISGLLKDPFNDVISDPCLEVKLEAFQENGANEFCSTTDNQQSGSDGDSNCSNGSNDGAGDDSDDNISDPLVHSLYPKWLIEVEKKRADAELIRAKAEEQRTNIAAKNAEAAMVQAEALKKLADASSLQADAMARIAAMLENRMQRDNSILTI